MRLSTPNYHPKPLDGYVVPVGGIAVDVGCAIGEFPKKYHSDFERILCIEPVYDNFVEAVERNREYENVTILPLAFSHTSGEVTELKLTGGNKYNFMSDTHEVLGEFSAKKAKTEITQLAPTISLSSILELVGGEIDFLKMDCEGSELSLTDDESVRAVKAFSMEPHPWVYGKEYTRKLRDWLSRYFKIIDKDRLWHGTRK